MIVRIIKEVETPTDDHLITEQQAIDIVNMNATLERDGKKLTEEQFAMYVRSKIGIDKNKALEAIKKLVEVRDMIERIILGKAFLVHEESHMEIDPETELPIKVIDVPAEMCPVPRSFEKLIERSLQIINQDYNLAEDQIFEASDINEAVEAFTTIILTIIQTVDSTGEATFDEWKEKVILDAAS